MSSRKSPTTTTTTPFRQRRTSRGRPWGRRKVGGSRGEGLDDLATQPRPAVRQRRRDGGIGERRGGEGCDQEGRRSRDRPPTKGHCEHGVKPRSRCKVCGACPHGKWRRRCKDCGGSGICEHGRRRSQCKECGGSQICEHGRRRSLCKECGGSEICEHGRQRSHMQASAVVVESPSTIGISTL